MLGEKAPDVTKVMGELGIDVSKNRPKQLTEEMTKEANLIINLAPEKPVPDFIDRNKMVIWHVEDGKGKSYDIVVKIRDQIKRHVEELVAEIG
jgi:arsenate reductase (thioredoxin)